MTAVAGESALSYRQAGACACRRCQKLSSVYTAPSIVFVEMTQKEIKACVLETGNSHRRPGRFRQWHVHVQTSPGFRCLL